MFKCVFDTFNKPYVWITWNICCLNYSQIKCHLVFFQKKKNKIVAVLLVVILRDVWLLHKNCCWRCSVKIDSFENRSVKLICKKLICKTTRWILCQILWKFLCKGSVAVQLQTCNLHLYQRMNSFTGISQGCWLQILELCCRTTHSGCCCFQLYIILI